MTLQDLVKNPRGILDVDTMGAATHLEPLAQRIAARSSLADLGSVLFFIGFFS